MEDTSKFEHESRESDQPLASISSDTTTTLSRRAFLRMAGTAAAGAAVSACFPFPGQPKPQGGEKVQLVYQDWRTEWFPPMARQMLEEFHVTHPNIRVYYTPDPENVEDKMLADMQAGTAPDVFSGCCDFYPVWAQKGYTLNLHPYVQADLDRDTINDWDPAQYKAFFTRDGQQFGLPKYHGVLALYYNKDIFDQYRVDYPNESWNHDDYLTAMKKLTRDYDADDHIDIWGSMIDIAWERIQLHVNGWGGGILWIPMIRLAVAWPIPRPWQRWSGYTPACGMIRS